VEGLLLFLIEVYFLFSLVVFSFLFFLLLWLLLLPLFFPLQYFMLLFSLIKIHFLLFFFFLFHIDYLLDISRIYLALFFHNYDKSELIFLHVNSIYHQFLWRIPCILILINPLFEDYLGAFIKFFFVYTISHFFWDLF